MGQYYITVLVQNDKIHVLKAYSFNEGVKLMEHSYINNTYMKAVESIIGNIPTKVVWAGDYADPEDEESYYNFTGRELKQDVENPYNLHKYLDPKYGPNKEIVEPIEIVKIPYNTHLSFGSWNTYEIKNGIKKSYQYILNHTKKQYVDTFTCKPKIHPLSLLTAEGNGLGGGDFRGRDENLCGYWSRDLISLTNDISTIPEDFTIFTTKFKEDRQDDEDEDDF